MGAGAYLRAAPPEQETGVETAETQETREADIVFEGARWKWRGQLAGTADRYFVYTEVECRGLPVGQQLLIVTTPSYP